MKKLLLAVLVFLVASIGFAQTDEPTEAEIAEMMKVYKAYKAKQNADAQAQAQANTQARYEKALIEAAKAGNAAQVRGLLEAGTAPNVTDKDGNTPLYYAVDKNLAMVDMLLYAGADMNYGQDQRETPLFRSMRVLPNDDSIRLRLLKEKFDPNAVVCQIVPSGHRRCFVLLFAAVQGNNLKMVDTLIKRGADVNKYVGRNTPLIKALQKGQDPDGKITELLLKAGADPYRGLMLSSRYTSPLTYVQQDGNKTKIKLLKEAMEATKEQRKKDDKLLKAAQKGKVEEVRKLLAEGANPNAYANYQPKGLVDGHTALMFTDNLEIAQLLVDAGADVNAVDDVGWTALMWAWKPKQLEKVKWLIAHGANVNYDRSGDTPLTLAINADYYWERVETLLNAGADVNLRDKKGYGPLFYAKLNDNKKVEEELLKRHATLTKKESEDIIEAIAEKSRQAQAAANSDGESLGKTFLKGLVDTGMSTLQYAIDNGKF